MDGTREQRRIREVKNEVKDILEGLGVELDYLGHNPKSLYSRHERLFMWIMMLNMARAIEAKTVTVEQLEQVDGVGRATAERIVESLS